MGKSSPSMSRLSRMSRASRATVCGAGELFNILIERMHLVKSLSKVTGPGWMARSLTGYHPVPIIMPLSSMSVLGKE